MKTFELTNNKLVILILISHASLLYTLVWGSALQIFVCFLLFSFITLFASTVTYHRLLSHRSWNAPRWYEIFGSFLGILSFTGSTISRTAVHRQHHKFSDKEGDPHSPRIVGRFFVYFPVKNNNNINPKLVIDLLKDPVHRFIHKWYLLLIIALFLFVMLILGPAWSISAVLAPGALCWINISILNMCGHSLDGYAVDKTWLSYLTFGEGHHKFHHDHPNEAHISRGTFDPGYFVIKLFEKK